MENIDFERCFGIVYVQALQEKEELKEKISELVTQKDEMHIWYEKVTRNANY